MSRNNVDVLLVAAVLLFLLTGCYASKKNHYDRLMLQNIDSAGIMNVMVPELKFQKGDLLAIQIFSESKEATEIFNQSQGEGGSMMGGGAAMLTTGRGYLIDPNGDIYIHKIGKIKAEGLTRQQLMTRIQESMKVWLKEPYVTIRYANNRVNVMGEVGKPGVVEISDQKVSILDIISMAGDFTQFSRRDNVLLVREENGVRKVIRFDIRSKDVYQSPYFYLQQNDLVYVEPNRRKPTGNEQVLMRNIAIGTSILSVVTLLITLLTR